MSVLTTFFGGLNKRLLASTVSVSVASTALVFAAVQSDGSAATDVNLNDGSVWVTFDDRVGRLNIRIRELDVNQSAAIAADVVQDGRNVYFSGEDGGVQQINPLTRNTNGSNDALIEDYQLRGRLGLLHDRETGRLWVGPGQNLVGDEYPDEADAWLEPGSFSAIGVESSEPGQPARVGRLFVVDETGWWELALDENGRPVRAEADEEDAADVTTTVAPTTTVPDGELIEAPPEPLIEAERQPLGVPFSEIAAISTVGERVAMLTVDGRVGGIDQVPTRIPGEDHRLQQASDESNVVLVSSTAGLFAVPLEGGDGDQLAESNGLPAAPVRVGPCIYSAWAGDPSTFFKQCDDQVVNPVSPIPGAAVDEPLVWRVNGPNIALNSPGDGGVWADHEGTLSFAGNWSDVEADSDDEEEQEDTTGESQRIVEKICIDGSAQAPTAGDDELGVRPRQSIVNVLNNDDDVNCEPIAITQVIPSGGEWGQLTIIDNGQHILYSPSDEVLQSANDELRLVQFDYVVSDAAGNTSDPATVTLAVKGRGVANVGPELRPKSDDTTRQMRTVVEAGRAVSQNVMADWWDPDGDDLRLVDARALDAGEVSATPDGVVRFAANGVSPGVYQVEVTMSDGLLQKQESLEVTVKPTGSPIPPVVENDFVTLAVGQTGTVSPLANDSDPNEDSLDLLPLWLPDEEGAYRTSLQGGEVSITALAPGSYQLPYEATDGVDATRGFIRLEVRAPAEQNSGPIGVPDQVKIRSGRVINVDVLDNDIDLDGDVLAVTDVAVTDTPPEFGELRATIVDRRLVQIEVVPGSDGSPPTGPFTVRYTLTDGRDQDRLATQTQDEEIAAQQRATGAVTVLVQPTVEDQPPQLTADQATVRSGDVVRVPVLRNDADPDADELVLESVDADQAAAIEANGQGVAWVQGRYVYFKGGEPGRVALLYNASAGNKRATSEVVFQVTPLPDPATNPNQAPSPKNVVARAIRNGEVRIPVDVFGVDGDGDSVVLLDEFNDLQGAAQGNRVRLDPEDDGVILFAAGANSLATDSFSYTVKDPHGLTGTAEVQVMVLDDGGWPPAAHDDVYVGKPGRTLSIPVLANDTSPQDRRLELDADPFFDLDGQPTTEPVNGEAVTLLDQQDVATRGRINVVVPTDGSTLVEHYRIFDGLAPASAYIRVSGDPEIPNVPPVAVLDEIPLDDVRGQDAGSIDVLLNDYDPDDAGGGLSVEIPASQAVTADGDPITVEGSTVTVPLTELAQTVLYRITDADGGQAIGFIRVPGKENHPPELSDAGRDITNRTIEASSPSPLTIALDDIVVDPDGDPDIRLTPTEVRVATGNGAVTRLDDGTGFVFTPSGEAQTNETVLIEFEVTDRPDNTPDERALPNCNCVARLSVEVLIEASSPPRVLSVGAVPVPQLDEEVTYDVAPLTIDDQGDALTYDFDPSSYGGLEVTQNGSQITLVSRLAEDQKIPLGSVIPIRYTVDDGTFDPVQNVVNVTMIATNRGQPATGAFPTLEAERDFAIDTPNFIDAASNPFPDRPLTLINSSVDGGAQITCQENGACQFFSDTVGTFIVTYTIKDAVDQTATGTLEVVVKGKPRAPGVPRIESVGNYVVNLSWTAADMQGAEFVEYVVTAVESGDQRRFTNTGGEFDGLTNGTAYTFTVYAVNELGDGEVSNPSSPGIPDRVPDPPVNPQITDYQDGALTLEWEPPPTAGEFTPILQYEVSIGGQVINVSAPATSVTVGAGGQGSPLINGTDYQFRVRAQNSATVDNGWGSFGVLSGPERPSRYPDQPTNVRSTNSGDGGSPRLSVTWNAPGFDGGRAIESYRVCMVGGSGGCQTTAANDREATFNVARNEQRQFYVVAINSDKNRAESDDSGRSPAVTGVGNPDAPSISIQSSGDKRIVASASTPNNHGCSQSANIEYSRNGGSSWQSSGTFTGLTNGQQYTIIARATLPSSCGTAGQTYRSPNSSGATATPYGDLVTPSVDVQSSGTQIRTTWNANRSDDGRPSWSFSLSGNAPGCSGSATSGDSGWVDVGYAVSRSCTVTASASGVGSRSDSDSATTVNPPRPTLSVSRGGFFDGGTCAGASPRCRYVNGSGSNWTPGAQFWVRCDAGSSFVDTSRNIPVTYRARYISSSGTITDFNDGICGSNFSHSVTVWTNQDGSATATVGGT